MVGLQINGDSLPPIPWKFGACMYHSANWGVKPRQGGHQWALKYNAKACFPAIAWMKSAGKLATSWEPQHPDQAQPIYIYIYIIHIIYIYIYINHIYQPTTNQQPTNNQPTTNQPSPPSTTDHQSSTIHRSTVPSLSQRHGSCRTGQFHLLHQVFGLGRNPQMMDVHQDGDFMDILWGFSQKLSLSHLIKINIV